MLAGNFPLLFSIVCVWCAMRKRNRFSYLNVVVRLAEQNVMAQLNRKSNHTIVVQVYFASTLRSCACGGRDVVFNFDLSLNRLFPSETRKKRTPTKNI